MTYRGLAVHLLAAATVDLDWSSRWPSKGKCTVTALVVQDYLGGELLRAPVEDVSHYWNRLDTLDTCSHAIPAMQEKATVADRGVGVRGEIE